MKKIQSNNQRNIQASLFALALAAAIPAAAHGHDYEVRREAAPEVRGQVEIVREVPGGAVRVGVEVGRPRPVVVEEKKVIVVHEENRCPRQVTVIRHEPAPTVEIIRESKHRTVIIKRDGYGRIINETIVEKNRGNHGGHGNHGNHGRWSSEGSDDDYGYESGRGIHEGYAYEHGGHGDRDHR
jgi:hypothetical protein